MVGHRTVQQVVLSHHDGGYTNGLAQTWTNVDSHGVCFQRSCSENVENVIIVMCFKLACFTSALL